jgi:hypothetical protein
MQKHVLLALILVFGALYLEAATTITPAVPTAQDIIIAAIDVPSSTFYNVSSTSVAGNVIRTNLPILGFGGGPPVFGRQEFAAFGPLAPGTYTYEVYQTYQGQPVLLSQQTIVVAPVIPIMDSFWLSILAMLLATIGYFTLGKCSVR